MNDHRDLEGLVRRADKDGLQSALREHAVPESVLSHLLFLAVRHFERKLAEEMFECIDIVLRNNVSIHCLQNGRSLLAEAVVDKGCIDLVKRLADKGLRADRFDQFRKNALVYALERNPEDPYLVEQLAKDPRVFQADYQIPPLIKALQLRKFRCARKLIESSQCCVNQRTEAGDTALHVVVGLEFRDIGEQLALVRHLIQHKAKMLQNSQGKFPHQLSAHQEVRQLLQGHVRLKEKPTRQAELKALLHQEEDDDDMGELGVIVEADEEEEQLKARKVSKPDPRKARKGDKEQIRESRVNRHRRAREQKEKSTSIESAERASRTVSRIEQKFRGTKGKLCREHSQLSHDSKLKSEDREGARPQQALELSVGKRSQAEGQGQDYSRQAGVVYYERPDDQVYEPYSKFADFQAELNKDLEEDSAGQPSEEQLLKQARARFQALLAGIEARNLELSPELGLLIGQLQRVLGKVMLYGSLATGLNIPQSDVDLLCLQSYQFMQRLEEEQSLQLCPDVAEVRFIWQASVPLIKITSRRGRRVDVTFWHQGHSGLESCQFVKKIVEVAPSLRKKVQALKALLYSRSLSDVYSGGLSSHGLFLMVLCHEQMAMREDGRSLLQSGDSFRSTYQFLRFFGECFDFRNKALLIQTQFQAHNVVELDVLSQHYSDEKLVVVVDPLRGHNVARGCFRVGDLQCCFAEGLALLRMGQIW